jgi:Sec-independent protein secretion pathway component TatC
MPCFNSQAPPLDHHSNTVTRRLLVIVVGVTVLLSINYYQAFILNSMMVQDLSTPYTVDELAEKLYANEVHALFWEPTSDKT